MARAVQPTNVEVFFDAGDIIVSKTDLKGRITYANEVFLSISGFTERECLGQPHSLIRHPDMPRAIFKLLWDTLLSGQEIFAYVKNMTKRGDHYWVLAHVTPSYDANRQMVGFHSNRRHPRRSAINSISPLYQELVSIERRSPNGRDGLAASTRHLQDFIRGRKVSYDQIVLAL